MPILAEHPGPFALPLVMASGAALCLGFLIVAEVSIRMVVQRLRGASARGTRLYSLLTPIVVASLLCCTVQVRCDGFYPGWQLRLLGCRFGAYVDRTGQDFRMMEGMGDPRRFMESSWLSAGRVIVYGGRERIDSPLPRARIMN